MKKTIFPLFHQTYQLSGKHVPFDTKRHGDLSNKVPSALLTEWQNYGFGGFSDGLIWTSIPNKPILNVDDWTGMDKSGIEVLRTAFADVCLWQNGQFIWLNPYSGNFTELTSDVDILFESTLTRKSFRDGILLEPLFKEAIKKYGELTSEDCFGFAPLPSFGGAISKEYLVKVKMREYLSLLAKANN